MLRFVLTNSVLLGTADVEQRGGPALHENCPSFSISSSSIVAVDVTPSHRFDLSDGTCACREVRFLSVRTDLSKQLQALVYDILPPTTAITDYATGLEKAVS